MKRFVGLSLAAGLLFTCMAASSSQAAPVSGVIANPTAQSSGIVAAKCIGGTIIITARGAMVIAIAGDAKPQFVRS